jgi:DNA processing protein
LTEDEQTVLKALTSQARHIDQLCRHLGMDVARLSALLLVLEVRGLVRRLPGMMYLLP